MCWIYSTGICGGKGQAGGVMRLQRARSGGGDHWETIPGCRQSKAKRVWMRGRMSTDTYWNAGMKSGALPISSVVVDSPRFMCCPASVDRCRHKAGAALQHIEANVSPPPPSPSPISLAMQQQQQRCTCRNVPAKLHMQVGLHVAVVDVLQPLHPTAVSKLPPQDAVPLSPHGPVFCYWRGVGRRGGQAWKLRPSFRAGQ
jgi:hypothetical protein